MSAWMVSKAHIDALITLALYGPDNVPVSQWHPPYLPNKGGPMVAIQADKTGFMLIEENVKSIQARYPDTITNPDNMPGPCEQYWLTPYVYPAPFPVVRVPLATALKAIDCYRYQSCEHDGWEDSDARKFTDSLRNKLVTCIPGYDDAPWGID